jgi:hypothetical protein
LRSLLATSFLAEAKVEEDGGDPVDETAVVEKKEEAPVPVLPEVYKTTFRIKLGVGSPIKSPKTRSDKSPIAEDFLIL